MLAQIAARADLDEAVSFSMQHQGGDRECREQRTHISKKARPHRHGNNIDTEAEALAPCPPRPERFVARLAGSHDLQPGPRPPRFFQRSAVLVQGVEGRAPGVVVLPHVVGVGVDED